VVFDAHVLVSLGVRGGADEGPQAYQSDNFQANNKFAYVYIQ
jgi:hypothetical protein